MQIDKVMKKLFLAVVGVLMLSSVVNAKDVSIEVNQLPQAAQTFINNYFSNRTVSLVKKDTDYLDNSYDVYFTDGDKLEFNKKGEWQEVDCSNSTLPADIVPVEIRNITSAKYPGIRIIKIEKKKKSKGYEVKLSNLLELEFNKSYNLVDIDD